MAFWNPKKTIEEDKKQREINVICPYCKSVIERTYFKIVSNINYEWGDTTKGATNFLENNEAGDKIMLVCCPQCRHLLGLQEWQNSY